MSRHLRIQRSGCIAVRRCGLPHVHVRGVVNDRMLPAGAVPQSFHSPYYPQRIHTTIHQDFRYGTISCTPSVCPPLRRPRNEKKLVYEPFFITPIPQNTNCSETPLPPAASLWRQYLWLPPLPPPTKARAGKHTELNIHGIITVKQIRGSKLATPFAVYLRRTDK